jgi:hypothetical protein
VAIKDLNGIITILGLCEGNHCSEAMKNDRGHGKLIAMQKVTNDDGSCTWATIRKIKIPSSANFLDYSSITLNPESGRTAITSQEDSAVWLGQLLGRTPAGLWDLDKLEFDEGEAMIYDFPKNDDCQTVYCNIEGIHWMNDNMLMAVSDKMKGRGKQDFR